MHLGWLYFSCPIWHFSTQSVFCLSVLFLFLLLLLFFHSPGVLFPKKEPDDSQDEDEDEDDSSEEDSEDEEPPPKRRCGCVKTQELSQVVCVTFEFVLKI